MLSKKEVRKIVRDATDQMIGTLGDTVEDGTAKILITNALLLLERSIVEELDNHRERENEV